MLILAHMSASLAIPTVLSTIRSLFRTMKQQSFLLSIDLPIEKWCKRTREKDRFRDIGRNSPLVELGWPNSRERPSNKISPFKYISIYIYHYIINKIEVNLYAKRFKSGGTIQGGDIYYVGWSIMIDGQSFTQRPDSLRCGTQFRLYNAARDDETEPKGK